MMAAPFSSRAWEGAPLVQDAIAERCNVAAAYATAAANLAAVGDTAGLVHSLACAGRAIVAASEAAALLRPAQQDGGGR
ncbi:hypothetical protein SAMN05216360_1293 [Methylobacterium phyllostachyos]|uniref:Uncharacterized protein n=1 Tax=Methylobacterium phyllostachyos TaxID=582672 RepID=A0A1H0KSP7_9HYPH|nr:hypothetical protein [Methylobacterium phyllostachyos]SDO59024.1 hypothetical protein SAMN05216360_1293 [Methylobacterium phyllostachyos]